MALTLKALLLHTTSRLFVFLLSAAITLTFAWLLWDRESSSLEGMEGRMYDSYFRVRGPIPHPNQVVVVAIDDESLAEVGHWPWGRDILGELVDKLSAAGASQIMFDIIFPESTPEDAQFGEALRRAGNVIMPVAFNLERETWNDLEPFLLNSSVENIENRGLLDTFPPIAAAGMLPPVKALGSAARSIGSVQVFADEDGALRWEPLLIGYDDLLFPSAALISATRFLGLEVNDITLHPGKAVHIGSERVLPTDPWGRTPIHYYGGSNAFPYIKSSDVVAGTFDPSQIKGKIVLIGATAVGLHDQVVSPYSAGLPGVLKHANVISAILEKRWITLTPDWVNLLLLLGVGLVFAISASLFRAKNAFLSAIALSLLVLALGYGTFVIYGVLIMVAHTMLMLLVCLLATTTLKYLGEERRAGNIRMLFSNYVTERVVSELIRNPEIAKLGGQRKKVTILFSDIRSFTTFSENHSPEAVVTSLNEYLGEMTDTVFKYEGTLDKYIGDAVMAFWGAPLPQEDQARLAVQCGIEMLERLETLNEQWRREGRPAFEIGVGINTGEALVGNIGAEGKKMDYTVIGDTVNLASRTESLNKVHATHLLITEFTAAELDPEWRDSETGFKDIGEIEVKGKDRPVRFFCPRNELAETET